MPDSPLPPSGAQYELRLGEQHATVVEVGGGIREYRVGDRDVLHPYRLEQLRDGAHGTPLIPWPNRLGDGRYRFASEDYQVALTEPEKGNAIHGFLLWRPWQAAQSGEAAVTMSTTLHPRQGYPFALNVQARYELTGDGLVVTTTATNVGAAPCPYGCGHHPYLSPGTGTVDDCTLKFAAGTRIVTDAQRQLPVGTEPTAGTPYDFRTPRPIGELRIDYAFTDLDRDSDGRAWVSLTGADQRTAQLWVDDRYPLVELYTADTLVPQRRRRGLGTEPMTCPPNAFQTGEDVVSLEPDQSMVTTWGARLR